MRFHLGTGLLRMMAGLIEPFLRINQVFPLITVQALSTRGIVQSSSVWLLS